MASGTVGYTDTRGNKDYSSIIANQIGKRLTEASNMAASERAYAENQAEAGGTSLSEAGIGKGYFFGRALGSRFGGDRIARTRGRMGFGGAGTNPNATPAQRFRGGFDYKVTNEINSLTDTTPISNALVTGLRGVQGGLISVSQAIQRQDRSLGELANTQADMAKAIMFNGYLFQMFASQTKQEEGRRSARREEASIEGVRSRSRIGGSLFGGAGGGRGMINVTPRGGAGGGIGVGGRSKLDVGDVSSFGTSVALSSKRGQGLISNLLSGTKTGVRVKDVLRGAAAGKEKLAGEFLQNPKNFGSAMSKLIGGQISEDALTSIFTGKIDADAIVRSANTSAALVDAGVSNADTAGKLATRMGLASQGKQLTMFEVIEAGKRADKANIAKSAEATRDAMVFSKLVDSKGRKLFTKDQVAMFEQLGISPGAANVARFENRMAKNPLFKQMRTAGKSAGGFAEDIVKYFPEAKKFKNVEEAIGMIEFAKYIEKGVKPEDAVKLLGNVMGDRAAQKMIIDNGDILAKGTFTRKAIAKYAGKGAFARIGKALPGVGLALGTYFAARRLGEGDLFGAMLEVGSGIAGLFPGVGTKLGLGLDAYLIGRDAGLTPFNTGGRLSGFPVNSFLSVNGRPLATFNEPNNKESVQIVRDGEDAAIEQGKGIVMGMLKKRSVYTSLQADGVENAMHNLKGMGFFGKTFGDVVEGTKNVATNFMQPLRNAKNWFMSGFTPKEGGMSWKNLIKDDWMQRQFTQGPGKGMWNPFRGMPGYGSVKNFLTGKPGNEIAGGFQTGPTPLTRQLILRSFGLLTNPKALLLGSLMKPTALADGTLTGNIDALNASGYDTSALLNAGNGNQGNVATVVNNYYNQAPSSDGVPQISDETLGQAFNMDLEKFITNYSIMSK